MILYERQCPFCRLEEIRVILENEHAIALYDKYPVQRGHLLVIPKRHVASYFEATDEEIAAIHQLVKKGRELLDQEYSPDGYNIGVNVGEYGGQTVMHLHFHLIPRYKGDIDDPRGGIRKSIPNLNYYPSLDQKVKLLFLSSGKEAAIIAGRKDLVDNPDKAGGGFASMDLAYPAIYCRVPALGTVSHELNHFLVNAKKIGKAESVLQECQGQSFLVFYNGRAYVEDADQLINQYLQDHEAPNVISNAQNYKTKLNWDIYRKNEPDPDGHINSYRILGSMFSYLKYTFGPNAARRAMYTIYESKKDITEDVTRDTKLKLDDFLESWSTWMTSSGSEIGAKAEKAAKGYQDKLQQYDYAKIYLVSQKGEDSGGGDPGNDEPVDGNIDFTNSIQSKDLKVTAFTAAKKGAQIRFELIVTSTNKQSRGYSFFNPPDGDVIMKYVPKNAIKKGKNTIKIDVPVNQLQKVEAITIRFSDPANKWDQAQDMIYFEVGQLASLFTE